MDELKKETTQRTEDLFVVDDGYREIPIWNTIHERIGTLRYNASDLNIVNRYREIAGKFDNASKIAANADINPDGTGDGVDSIDALNRAEKELIEALDYLLQTDSRKAFFSVVNPFTPVNGSFYCENVMNKLTELIDESFNTELSKVRNRLAKQTHGYRTGKHKKGDR